jgi:hypothetical protein
VLSSASAKACSGDSEYVPASAWSQLVADHDQRGVQRRAHVLDGLAEQRVEFVLIDRSRRYLRL